MRSRIEQALETFNGRHTQPLVLCLATLPREGSTVDMLMEIAAGSETHVQIGATWLMKQIHDEGLLFTPEQYHDILDQLTSLALDWQSALHLLQILDRCPLVMPIRPRQFEALKRLTGHPKTLVRAWALNALCLAGTANPSFRNEVRAKVETAQATERGSVQARLRAATKRADWL